MKTIFLALGASAAFGLLLAACEPGAVDLPSTDETPLATPVPTPSATPTPVASPTTAVTPTPAPVMTPGARSLATPATTPAATPEATPMAVNGQQVSILVTALQQSGLADMLQQMGPHTVFAPTDQAFVQMPPRMLQDLLQQPEQLRAILLHHIVLGEVTGDQLARAQSLPTASGNTLTVSVEGGQTLVNGARVVATDIQTQSGVIHVIDQVLLPPTQ